MTIKDDRSNANDLRRLLRLSRLAAAPLGIAITATALRSAGNLGFPLLTQLLVDRALRPEDYAMLIRISVGFGLLALMVAILDFVAAYSATEASERITEALRNRVSAHALRILRGSTDDNGVEATDRAKQRISLLSTDAPMVGGLFSASLTQGVFQVLRFIGAFIFVAILSPVLLIAVPVVILVLTVPPFLLRARMMQASRTRQDAESDLLAHAVEFIEDVEGLVTLRGRDWAEEHLRYHARITKTERLRLERSAALARISYVAVWIVYGGTYAFAGWQAIRGSITIGEVLALGQLMALLALPTQAFGSIYTQYTTGLGAFERIREFLDTRPYSPFALDGANRLSGRSIPDATTVALPLELREVSVRYPGNKWSLAGVNLRVDSGEWIGIIGPNGAGKSTLTGLLAGLVAPTAGEVSAGGAPLARWTEPEFRRRVVHVSHRAKVYGGSLFENVTLGRNGISEERCRYLIRLVGLGDIVHRIGGIHGKLKSGEAEISAGERQRIVLMRALATKPELLILDEATNSIDPVSEALLLKRCREEPYLHSCLLVTHRESTLGVCDALLELSGGQLTGLTE